MENGSLHLPFLKNPVASVMDYCLDFQLPASSLTSGNFSEEDIENNKQLIALRCVGTTERDVDIKYRLYPFGMLLSVPFLVATVVVHWMLPELQTLHGKSLMCYVSGLAVANIVLATVQLASGKINDTTCLILALLVYYSFMLSFFWLNIMSFDIWWTFSGLGGIRGGTKSNDRKKFLYYSLYAWGLSTVAFAITLCLHYLPNIPSQYQPGLGVERCFLKKKAMFPYFYAPILILIVINIGFFSGTTCKIYGIHRETSVLRRDGNSKRHSKEDEDKQRFWLYIKLFLIMGVTWSMEIISWAVDEDIPYLWIPTDLINTIQGILIFVLFIWTPKTRQLLRKKFDLCRGKSTTSGKDQNPTSSSSANMSTSTTSINDKTNTN